MTPTLVLAGSAVAPETIVLYLFDVSGSFHTGRPDSPLARSARQLPRLVRTLAAEALRHPQRHVVSTIGALSYDDPLCDVTPSTSPFSGRQADVQQVVADCAERLRRLPQAATTDISGALDFGSRLLETDHARTTRAIVLFTDLVETRGANAPPAAEPRLEGACVVVIWAYTAALRKDPKALDGYITKLREKLTAARARAIQFELLSNDVAPSVARTLKRCRAES